MTSHSEHDHECEGGVCIRKVVESKPVEGKLVEGERTLEGEKVAHVVESKPVESKKVEEKPVVKDVREDDSSSVKQVVFSSGSDATCHSGCGHDHSRPQDH